MTSQPGEEAAVELPEDVERPEDDDHDLLTFGEAGARLEIEIRTLRGERIESPGGQLQLCNAVNWMLALRLPMRF